MNGRTQENIDKLNEKKVGYEDVVRWLERLRESQETISGNWNGEDDRFMSEGDIYNEEDAHLASETVEAIDKLLPLLKELYD